MLSLWLSVYFGSSADCTEMLVHGIKGFQNGDPINNSDITVFIKSEEIRNTKRILFIFDHAASWDSWMKGAKMFDVPASFKCALD